MPRDTPGADQPLGRKSRFTGNSIASNGAIRGVSDSSNEPTSSYRPPLQREGFEGAVFGIDDPIMGNALVGIDAALDDPVVRSVRVRQDLCKPNRARRRSALRRNWEAFRGASRTDRAERRAERRRAPGGFEVFAFASREVHVAV